MYDRPIRILLDQIVVAIAVAVVAAVVVVVVLNKIKFTCCLL